MSGSSTFYTFSTVESRIENGIKGCVCLEDAAQKITDVMYDEFKDSIVLVRLFATVPFGELPAPNQKFVTGLAASAGITSLINDQMLVLSLLGTRGEEPAWNSRHNSQGHVGIPLASGDFIESIPMMSRLLKAMGLGLDWIDSQDTEIAKKAMGTLAGVFYVPDAKTAVDRENRKIIAAQDFVAAHNVKTVFGLGGSYMLSKTFVVLIVFTREAIKEHEVRLYTPIINIFKTGTTHLILDNKVFTQ
jgi:hypothetical protein